MARRKKGAACTQWIEGSVRSGRNRFETHKKHCNTPTRLKECNITAWYKLNSTEDVPYRVNCWTIDKATGEKIDEYKTKTRIYDVAFKKGNKYLSK